MVRYFGVILNKEGTCLIPDFFISVASDSEVDAIEVLENELEVIREEDQEWHILSEDQVKETMRFYREMLKKTAKITREQREEGGTTGLEFNKDFMYDPLEPPKQE